MADQGWVDQANLLTAWDNNNSPYAWVDQATMLVVWEEPPDLPTFTRGSSANLFEQLSGIVTGYADHESSAQKTKRCEDHFSEDYDDDSLASAFYAMEN